MVREPICPNESRMEAALRASRSINPSCHRTCRPSLRRAKSASALRSAMAPLMGLLEDPRVIEVMLNADGVVWVDTVRRRNSERGPLSARGRRVLDLPGHGDQYRSVIDLLRNVVAAFARLFAPHAVVAAENLLLRHQLIVLRRSSPRPRLRRLDRWLIATLATRASSLGEVVEVVLGVSQISGTTDRARLRVGGLGLWSRAHPPEAVPRW